MKLSEFTKISIYNHPHTLKEHLIIDKELAKECDDQELIIRFWIAEGIALGKMDTLTADFEKGKKYLEKNNLIYEVRSSGGLAVVLDCGTLNMSFIFSPKKSGKHLNDSYLAVTALLQLFMKTYDVSIQKGTVQNSYCPGDYDLSVNGKKFCGISQYRSKEFVIVMLNMVVNGNQSERLEVLRKFYKIANTRHDSFYPTIQKGTMETLSNLMQLDITPGKIINDFKIFLLNHHKNILVSSKKFNNCEYKPCSSHLNSNNIKNNNNSSK